MDCGAAAGPGSGVGQACQHLGVCSAGGGFQVAHWKKKQPNEDQEQETKQTTHEEQRAEMVWEGSGCS